MHRRVVPVVSLLAMVALVVSVSVCAQQARSGGGGGNEQLVQQVQQLASERTELQSQNAKLQRDLDAGKHQLDDIKQQLAAARAGSARSQSALSAALASTRAAAEAAKDSDAKSLADARSKMQDLVDHYRATTVTLRDTELQRARLLQELTESKVTRDQCAQRNESLSKVTAEVLDRYEHQGAFSYMARAEPFTRLKRTQIENLVLEDRQRVEELRVKQTDPAASGDPAPGAVQFRANSDGR